MRGRGWANRMVERMPERLARLMVGFDDDFSGSGRCGCGGAARWRDRGVGGERDFVEGAKSKDVLVG